MREDGICLSSPFSLNLPFTYKSTVTVSFVNRIFKFDGFSTEAINPLIFKLD